MLTVFQYIAHNDPQQGADLCSRYNIEVSTVDDVADGLCDIAYSGDEGFMHVMSLHPEKEILSEKFGSQANNNNSMYNNDRGECTACKLSNILRQTNQANGGNSTAPPYQLPQNNNSLNSMVVMGIISLTIIAILFHHSNSAK